MKTIYEDIYKGDFEEAKIKFPFLIKGLHLKVLQSICGTIGIFPKESSFYVVTFETHLNNKKNIVIEETNSIRFLNIIVNRVTGEKQYLDEDDMLKIKKFLNDNNCNYIL